MAVEKSDRAKGTQKKIQELYSKGRSMAPMYVKARLMYDINGDSTSLNVTGIRLKCIWNTFPKSRQMEV